MKLRPYTIIILLIGFTACSDGIRSGLFLYRDDTMVAFLSLCLQMIRNAKKRVCYHVIRSKSDTRSRFFR